VARRHPDVRPQERLGALALNWVLGVLLVYATLFGTGYLIVGRTVVGLVLVAIALTAAFVLWGTIGRTAATPTAAPGSSR
jgi:hypothetical protein